MSEQYDAIKKELQETLAKQKQYEQDLSKLEQEIYDKETQYFNSNTYITTQSTKPLHIPGNIIKGFDGFNRSQHYSNDHKDNLNANDRIFSLSSANYIKQIENTQNNNSNGNNKD